MNVPGSIVLFESAMVLCCKPNSIIPLRRLLNIVLSERCQFSIHSVPILTRPCASYKLKPCSYSLENCWISRPTTNLAFHQMHHSTDILFRSREQLRYTHYQRREYSNEVEENKNEPEKKLSLFQRLKQMFKEYWYVVVPVHVITSTMWYGSFYYLVKSGVDITETLKMLGASEKVVDKLHNSNMGYFALAYAMYKIATPARYTVTLGGTTLSIKYLKDWGYIKPMPPAKEIKGMINEKKEILREKRENIRGFYKEKLKKRNERKNAKGLCKDKLKKRNGI